MGEDFKYQKSEKGCIVYVTVNCSDEDKKPCYKKEEEKRYDKEEKKYDKGENEDKADFREDLEYVAFIKRPHYRKDY